MEGDDKISNSAASFWKSPNWWPNSLSSADIMLVYFSVVIIWGAIVLSVGKCVAMFWLSWQENRFSFTLNVFTVEWISWAKVPFLNFFEVWSSIHSYTHRDQLKTPDLTTIWNFWVEDALYVSEELRQTGLKIFCWPLKILSQARFGPHALCCLPLMYIIIKIRWILVMSSC